MRAIIRPVAGLRGGPVVHIVELTQVPPTRRQNFARNPTE